MSLNDQSGDHILMSNGAKLTAGGTWTNSCSVTLKNLINKVDGSQMLERIAQLPIYHWNYKSNVHEDHIGPTAEDFHQAFQLGESDRHISALDLSGIALSGVKALKAENEKLRLEISKQKAQTLKLEQELKEIRLILGKIVDSRSASK